MPEILFPKPQILTSLADQGHAIIEASAGTGKTFTLEHLIIELLVKHPNTKLENILVVTFTERATSELKTRVRRLISHIVTQTRSLEFPQDHSLTRLCDANEPHWIIDTETRRKLEHSLFTFDTAPIYTIHGFCQRVLTEFSFAHQKSFDQQHIEFPILFERSFRSSMRETLSTTDSTRDWLEAWLEVGTVEELQNLLARVVVLQSEIWPRLREDELSTLMAEFGPKFWQHYSSLYTKRCTARERAFRLAQEDYVQHKSVARFLMLADKEVIDLKASLRNAQAENDEQQRFLSLIGKLLRFKPAVAQKFLPLLRESISDEKSRSNTYTYDDMLSMVWQSLQGPNGPWLAQTLRRKYHFALIDEFQDTDELQWNIFSRLFYEPPQSHGLYIIGDPKQAIYAFRGADVHTYLQARTHMQSDTEKHCDTIHLEENFRSTSSLIEAYNTILDQNASEPFFSGKSIQYDHPVRCGNPDLVALDSSNNPITPIVIGEIKRKENEKGSARMSEIYECYGRWIAVEILKLLHDDGALYCGPSSNPKRIQASDILILTRTHADEKRLLPFLQEENIPCIVHKHQDLFQTSEAWVLYEVFRAIERPYDAGRRLKAWGTPIFGVHLDDLVHCRDLLETHPLYQTLLEWATLARRKKFELLFHQIAHTSGLIRREIFFQDNERDLTNYLQLFEVLLEEAYRAKLDFPQLVSRLKSFIDQKRKPLGTDAEVKRIETEKNAVQIMTMHKSKGLEAEVVFLYPFGGFAGEFWQFHYTRQDGSTQRALHILKPEARISPKLRARVEEESREEDERLLYVSLTRARSRLYLPFVPYAGSQPICKSITSRSYHVLNKRLFALTQSLEQDDATLSKLFLHQEIPFFGSRQKPPAPLSLAPDILNHWQPPSKYLPVDETQDALTRPRSMRVASYSSIKHKLGGYLQTSAPPTTHVPYADDEAGTEDAIVDAQDLPGGVRTGQFLHEVLELLDYQTLQTHESFDSWKQNPQVLALFRRLLLEYGLESRFLEQSQHLVYKALTLPVQLPNVLIPGVGLCESHMREMEFVYPIPETHHPSLGSSWNDTFEVNRGFIKGYIDYVFEWDGLIYFADWKSDILENYEPDSLQTHFHNNYEQQALLYTIALCKMLSLDDETSYRQRFGGSLYIFLRGLNEQPQPTPHGIFSSCPSWNELQEFEALLQTPGFDRESPS